MHYHYWVFVSVTNHIESRQSPAGTGCRNEDNLRCRQGIGLYCIKTTHVLQNKLVETTSEDIVGTTTTLDIEVRRYMPTCTCDTWRRDRNQQDADSRGHFRTVAGTRLLNHQSRTPSLNNDLQWKMMITKMYNYNYTHLPRGQILGGERGVISNDYMTAILPVISTHALGFYEFIQHQKIRRIRRNLT